MKKTISKIIIFCFVIFGISIFLYLPVIFQEGNPLPQLKGIVQLNFSSDNIVKLSNADNLYLTKSKNGQGIIKNLMKDRGYEFIEQMGAGYFFETESGERVIVTHRFYSRFYSLWTIVPNTKQTKNNIVEELRECLPKSDIASHEKCQELLKAIVNYDDCVNAGFFIIKSNPPQCTTPDERIFIDESNSTWEMVLISLHNCEVEKAFQTHSKLVTLKLKNGNELKVYEPNLDDVMKVMEEVESKCGKMVIGTE